MTFRSWASPSTSTTVRRSTPRCARLAISASSTSWSTTPPSIRRAASSTTTRTSSTRCIGVDLTAAWYLIRKTIGPMRELGRGSIVNVGSVAAYNGGRGREGALLGRQGGPARAHPQRRHRRRSVRDPLQRRGARADQLPVRRQAQGALRGRDRGDAAAPARRARGGRQRRRLPRLGRVELTSPARSSLSAGVGSCAHSGRGIARDNSSYRTVDADNHYYETRDAFTRHIEPRFADADAARRERRRRQRRDRRRRAALHLLGAEVRQDQPARLAARQPA